MSMKLMAKVFDLDDIELTALELLILLKLAENTNDETGECWPSYNYLARKCRCSRRSAIYACKQLEKKLDFFNKLTRKVEYTKNLSNTYIFDFDLLDKHEFERLKEKFKDGAGDAPPSARAAPPSAGDAPPLVQELHPPSAGDAPRTSNLTSKKEPVIEPVKETTAKKPGEDDAKSHNDAKKKQKRLTSEKTKQETVQAKEVFSYWQDLMDKPRARLNDKKRSLINKAIKNYSLEDVKLAILGCSKSSWHMGANPSGKIYNNLDLILRNDEKIESFMDEATTQKSTGSNALPFSSSAIL